MPSEFRGSKHNDLSLEPRTHVKARIMVVQGLQSLYWEDRDVSVLGACSLASLAEFVISRFGKRSCLKN